MAPGQSDRTHGEASTVTHDKDFNPTTKRTCAQVTKEKKSTETKKPPEGEQMITPQQNHNVDSLNRETLDCSMCEAQTLANTTCNFNKTFKTEDDFTNPWQQSKDMNKELEFSRETDKLFNNGEHCEQYAQQCTLEKGIKKHGKRGEESKEIGQPHEGACFEPMQVKDMTLDEKRQAEMALTHLTEKRNSGVKGRTAHNGEPTRE